MLKQQQASISPECPTNAFLIILDDYTSLGNCPPVNEDRPAVVTVFHVSLSLTSSPRYRQFRLVHVRLSTKFLVR